MRKAKKIKYFLIFAIKGIIFGTYEKINRIGTDQANQYGTNAFKSVFIKCQSDFRANDNLWRIATTGLSLRPGSSTDRARITSPRAEDRFYRQASSKLNTTD